jgi:hypothetical protein
VFGQKTLSRQTLGQLMFGQITSGRLAGILSIHLVGLTTLSFDRQSVGTKLFTLLTKCHSAKWFSTRETRSLKQNCPIFRNVAKTVAKLQKLKLKVKNSCIKLLVNVRISTTTVF